ACPALRVDRLGWQDVPPFAYGFNDQGAPEPFLPPVSFPYGAAHASELAYFFSPRAAVSTALTADQHNLASSLVDHAAGCARGCDGGWGLRAALCSLVRRARFAERSTGPGADQRLGFGKSSRRTFP